jgi:hypothetical protein
VVRLHAPDGRRVVDESLALSLTSGTVTRKVWDLFEVGVPLAGDVSFDLSAAGASLSPSAQVVPAIDTITLVAWYAQGGSNAVEGQVSLDDSDGRSVLCFMADAGGTPTFGATWTFEPSAGLEVLPKDPSWIYPTNGCVSLVGTALGSATLTVGAGGASLDVPIEVVGAL